MRRGYIKMWRRSLDSMIFAHAGMWKLFCLCLMKAAREEREVTFQDILKPIKLSPGQFVTGRFSLHEDYHQAHLKKRYSRKAAPTAITLYRWLLNLQYMQILNIKTYNKYSIITVINWNLYQINEQQMNNKRTTDEHKQEGFKKYKETPEIISNEISLLKNKYLNQEIINQAFTAIKSTRKTNRIKDTVKLSILQAWDQCPVESVMAGIRIYLDKGYHLQGKNEDYLQAIIKNQKPAPNQGTSKQYREITPENLGELYEN